jgi:RNA polymerase sigma-70 factor, ECF subfamily
MPTPEPQRLTELLVAWSDGDQKALNDLFPLVYDELRQLARRHMRRERRGHTLRTTALVNDAYLRLVDQRQVRWQNRAHFFAIAAQMMRRILVDHARAKHYEKRGGGAAHVPLEEAAVVSEGKAAEILALDEALRALAEIDPRRASVVELRYFGGLSNEEIAEVLKVSTNTVTRDWNMARAWLYHELSGGAPPPGEGGDG